MDQLQTLRKEIDRIDQEILVLFKNRFEITREIGAYKKVAGLPIQDTKREEEMKALYVERARAIGLDTAFATALLETILEGSRTDQLAQDRVAND